MFIITIGPPFNFMLWRIFNHVLLDWCNIKYSIYYNNVLRKEETKVNSFKSSNYEKKKNTAATVSLIIIC